MILKESMLLTILGVIIGLPMAMLVGRALAASLYNVKPLDAGSYLLSILGIAVVSLVASAIPAARAASVNPMRALRME
jgi:ABC-type antimicrobial peptide transport system permease subunit